MTATDSRLPIRALVISAMPQEMAPMHAILEANPGSGAPIPSPIGRITQWQTPTDSVVCAVTGIGFAATASCLGWLLAHYAPQMLVSIGSAGGLSAESRVRELVLGTSYRDGGADGSAFGYVRGQVPGQPEYFSADAAMLETLRSTLADPNGPLADIATREGEVLSSDTFVTDSNVGDMREAFPAAVSADMESYAAAHVAHQWGIPFISLRAISDLCASPEDQAISFHAELSEVAEISARSAWELVAPRER